MDDLETRFPPYGVVKRGAAKLKKNLMTFGGLVQEPRDEGSAGKAQVNPIPETRRTQAQIDRQNSLAKERARTHPSASEQSADRAEALQKSATRRRSSGAAFSKENLKKQPLIAAIRGMKFKDYKEKKPWPAKVSMSQD